MVPELSGYGCDGNTMTNVGGGVYVRSVYTRNAHTVSGQEVSPRKISTQRIF
ncbi:MAG: hypothetical protein ACLVB1_10395 [Blautia obeum]